MKSRIEGRSVDLSPITLLERRLGGRLELDKVWLTLKYVIVGMMETIAITSMIAASIFLSSPAGTLAILMGLVVGVLGLAIYDGWRA